MKTRGVLFSLILIGAAASPVFGHGSNQHLMGTTRELSENRLVVEDKSGNSHDVELGPKTKYRDAEGRAADASALRTGDRVVVHFGKAGAGAPAVEIRFNHSTP